MFVLIHKARAFFESTASLRDNRSTSYVFGIAAVVLALLARMALAPQLAGFPFLTFFPAIVLTGFICGWRPALVAAIFGGFAARYFFINEETLTLRMAAAAGWMGYALYLFAVSIILILVGVMDSAFKDFS